MAARESKPVHEERGRVLGHIWTSVSQTVAGLPDALFVRLKSVEQLSVFARSEKRADGSTRKYTEAVYRAIGTVEVFTQRFTSAFRRKGYFSPRAHWYKRRSQEGVLRRSDLKVIVPMVAKLQPKRPVRESESDSGTFVAASGAERVADVLSGVSIGHSPLLSSPMEAVAAVQSTGLDPASQAAVVEALYRRDLLQLDAESHQKLLVNALDGAGEAPLVGWSKVLEIVQDLLTARAQAETSSIEEKTSPRQLLSSAREDRTLEEEEGRRSVAISLLDRITSVAKVQDASRTDQEAAVAQAIRALLTTEDVRILPTVSAEEAPAGAGSEPSSVMLFRDGQCDNQASVLQDRKVRAAAMRRALKVVELASRCRDPLLVLTAANQGISMLCLNERAESAPGVHPEIAIDAVGMEGETMFDAESAADRDLHSGDVDAILSDGIAAHLLPVLGAMGLWREGLRQIAAIGMNHILSDGLQEEINLSTDVDVEKRKFDHVARQTRIVDQTVGMLLAANHLVSAGLLITQIAESVALLGGTGGVKPEADSIHLPLSPATATAILRCLADRHSDIDAQYFYKERILQLSSILLASIKGFYERNHDLEKGNASENGVYAEAKHTAICAIASAGLWKEALLALSAADWQEKAGHCVDVLVAASKGGIPWAVVKQALYSARSQFGHIWDDRRMTIVLHRCAVETGNWMDAISIFSSARNTHRQLDWSELDSVSLLRTVSQSFLAGSVATTKEGSGAKTKLRARQAMIPTGFLPYFTAETLAKAGQWEAAIETLASAENREAKTIHTSNQLSLQVRISVLKQLVKNAGEWELAMRFIQSSLPAVAESRINAAAPPAAGRLLSESELFGQSPTQFQTSFLMRLSQTLIGSADPSDWLLALNQITPTLIQGRQQAERKTASLLFSGLLCDAGRPEAALALLAHSMPPLAAALSVHTFPLNRPSVCSSTLLCKELMNGSYWETALSLCTSIHPPWAPTLLEVGAQYLIQQHDGFAASASTSRNTEALLAMVCITLKPSRGRSRFKDHNTNSKVQEKLVPSNRGAPVKQRKHQVGLMFELEHANPVKGTDQRKPPTEQEMKPAMTVKRPETAKHYQRLPHTGVYAWMNALAQLHKRAAGNNLSPQSLRQSCTGIEHVPPALLTQSLVELVQRIETADSKVRLLNVALEVCVQSSSWEGSLAVFSAYAQTRVSPPLPLVADFVKTQEVNHFTLGVTDFEQLSLCIKALYQFVGAKTVLRSFAVRLEQFAEGKLKRESSPQPPSEGVMKEGASATPTAPTEWLEALQLLSMFTTLGLKSVPQRTIQKLLTVPSLGAIQQILRSLAIHQRRTGSVNPLTLATDEEQRAMKISVGNLSGILSVCQDLGLRSQLHLLDGAGLQFSTEGSLVSRQHIRSSAGKTPLGVRRVAWQLLETGGSHRWELALSILTSSAAHHRGSSTTTPSRNPTAPIPRRLAEALLLGSIRSSKSLLGVIGTLVRCFGSTFPPEDYPEQQREWLLTHGKLFRSGESLEGKEAGALQGDSDAELDGSQTGGGKAKRGRKHTPSLSALGSSRPPTVRVLTPLILRLLYSPLSWSLSLKVLDRYEAQVKRAESHSKVKSGISSRAIAGNSLSRVKPEEAVAVLKVMSLAIVGFPETAWMYFELESDRLLGIAVRLGIQTQFGAAILHAADACGEQEKAVKLLGPP